MANMSNPDPITCRKKLSLGAQNLETRISSLELLQRPMIPLDIVPLTYNLEKIRRESGVFDSRGLRRSASIISTASQQDIDEVHTWLNQIGKPEHITLFDQKYVRNIRQCSTLNEEDLRCMGINFNIKYMLDEIDKLKSSTKRSCSVVKEEEEENQHVRALSAANRLQEESPAVRSARGKHQKGIMTQEELLQVIASDAVMLAVERETKTMTDSGGCTKTLRQQPINEPGSNDKQKENEDKQIRIFLSYRRSHSGEARSMKMGLERLGYKVFFDLDRDSGLGVGPFQQQLEQTLANTDVVLILITAAPSGPQSTVDTDGGRFNMSSTETMKEYARRGWTDYCGVEVEHALKADKIVIPVYFARHGTAWIGQQLSHLKDLPNLSPLRSLMAYDISDSLFVESIGVIDKHVKIEMAKVRGEGGGSADGGSSSSNNVGCGSCAVQ